MLKLLKLPKFGEIGKERAKRVLLLAAGGAILLGGIKLVAAKEILTLGNIPVSQEQLVNLGGKVVDKALGLLGRGSGESQGGENGEESDGQVAGAVEEAVQDPQKVVEKVVEKTVEKKVEEIIETIKKLPEEQAEKIKKEVMREICEEVCKD